MSFELLTIPCLSDNYAFLAHDPDTKATLLVDAPAVSYTHLTLPTIAKV